ncbi:MAG: hypothetical protein AAFV53_18395 [Myxococcota bacterium]
MALTVLLTGGRAAVTLELARMWSRAGHRVVMAETIGWHLSRYSNVIAAHHRLPWPTTDHPAFVDALERIIEQERVDLFLPTCEELFHVARARARLSQRCALPISDIDLLHDLHHKSRFVDRARAAGLAAPTGALAQTTDALRAMLQRALDTQEPVALKPVYSRFAAYTICRPRRLEEIDDVEVTADNPWLVQRFIDGRALCTWGFARQGRLLAHVTYPSRYTLGTAATVVYQPLDHPGAERWAKTFIAHTNFTGPIGFDLIEAPNGEVFGIECNPRLTGGLHLLAHQPALLDVILGESRPVVRPDGAPSAMLAVSMVLFLLSKVRTTADFTQWLHTFRASREVVHDRRDPIPAMWRYVWLAGILLRAHRMQIPSATAAGMDMEWNGERSDADRHF